jgi:hypothetical protein
MLHIDVRLGFPSRCFLCFITKILYIYCHFCSSCFASLILLFLLSLSSIRSNEFRFLLLRMGDKASLCWNQRFILCTLIRISGRFRRKLEQQFSEFNLLFISLCISSEIGIAVSKYFTFSTCVHRSYELVRHMLWICSFILVIRH